MHSSNPHSYLRSHPNCQKSLACSPTTVMSPAAFKCVEAPLYIDPKNTLQLPEFNCDRSGETRSQQPPGIATKQHRHTSCLLKHWDPASRAPSGGCSCKKRWESMRWGEVVTQAPLTRACSRPWHTLHPLLPPPPFSINSSIHCKNTYGSSIKHVINYRLRQLVTRSSDPTTCEASTRWIEQQPLNVRRRHSGTFNVVI